MKILAVSDTVTPALTSPTGPGSTPAVDMVISCGDLPPEYLSTLVAIWQVPLYYVRGNHDIRYEDTTPTGCTDIHLRLIRFRAMNILGIEGSRWYNGGPYQYTEAEMRWRLFSLRPSIWWGRGVDIVVAHAPPRFIHDAEDPCHRGFRTYRRLIDRYRPSYFLHGHIHRQFESAEARVTRIGDTQVINCYGHTIIDIPSETVAGKAVRRS
ncbi:MAG: metallophosphoesterase [Pseudomonadota bacterium]